jgi:hypothetical protein
MNRIFLLILGILFLNKMAFIYCDEKADNIFHVAFLEFLRENADEQVLYSRFVYPGKEREKAFSIIFIYKLSEPKGVVAFVDANIVINMFQVVYSNKFNVLVSQEVHGGLWEIEEAREILNLIGQICLKVIQCKEIILNS